VCRNDTLVRAPRRATQAGVLPLSAADAACVPPGRLVAGASYDVELGAGGWRRAADGQRRTRALRFGLRLPRAVVRARGAPRRDVQRWLRFVCEASSNRMRRVRGAES